MSISTSDAIKRFGENEQRVNTFVNQDGSYFTNESLPREVETLPSFMARMIQRYLTYRFKGAWASLTNYEVQDLVKFDNAVYICVENHTSSAFATELAANKWAVYQGIAANELADAINGASLVGYKGTTVKAYLDNNEQAFRSKSIAAALASGETTAGTKWEAQFHSNWNVIQTEVPFNPTEWQIYSNAAQGIAQVVAGTNVITRASGTPFDASWAGLPYFYYGGSGFKVINVIDANTIVVANTDGSPVSWGASGSDTFYFVSTIVDAIVNVNGATVTRISGMPFIPFYDFIYINGTRVFGTFVDKNTFTLSASLGVINGAAFRQLVSIANELCNIRLQGLAGANEENFVITHSPAGTTLQHSYAGAGKYRPIWIGTGECTPGTLGVHVGCHPGSAVGQNGWLTLGGDNGWQAVLVEQNKNNVNYLKMAGGPTGVTPNIAVRGSDSAVGLNIDVQGAQTVSFSSHSYGNTEFQVFGVGGSSWLAVGSSASNAPTLTANGAAAIIDIKLQPKNDSGRIWLGPVVNSGDAAIIGYMLVKDRYGAERKLAIIA